MQNSVSKENFITYKKHVESTLVDLMIDAYEKKQLTDKDIKAIAREVLKYMDRIKNHDEIIGFLSELSLRWPLFSPLAQIEEAKLKQAIEKKTALQVLKLISQNEIDSAIKLAHTVIS